MIEELPDIKANFNKTYLFRKEPLLEYVWEIALKFMPIEGLAPNEPKDSFAPCIFANRYAERNLTIEERYTRHKNIYPTYTQTFEEYSLRPYYKPLNDSFKERYLSNQDLQNTIQAFGLDVGKFWYLLLFVYDYIEDISMDTPVVSKTLIEEINEFCSKMKDATGIILRKDNRQCYDTESKGHKEAIIKFVNSALDLYTDTYNKIINADCTSEERFKQLKDYNMDYYNDSVLVDFTKAHTLEVTYKKLFFNEMFQSFLCDRKATNKVRTKYKISKDKWLFVSRLIYTVEYESSEGYNDDYDECGNSNRKLFNLLRRYNKDSFPRYTHRYYW